MSKVDLRNETFDDTLIHVAMAIRTAKNLPMVPFKDDIKWNHELHEASRFLTWLMVEEKTPEQLELVLKLVELIGEDEDDEIEVDYGD